MIFDPVEARLVDCNPRARELLGIPEAQTRNVHLNELYDEDDAYLRHLIDDVMDHEQDALSASTTRRDGRLVPTEAIGIAHPARHRAAAAVYRA